ncbi:MAG: ATP-binding protein [Chlamydiae bacterium]|nr:ATP-binding protein [Chlamydiota bacterium]MBI3265491.1 ATP-binding protein [Chlamydiota bacterium]
MDSKIPKYQNPWWENPQAMLDDQHLLAIRGKPYEYTPSLVCETPFAPGDIFVLRGPRQVGKTTTLKMFIHRLLQKECVDPHSVFYLSCEAIIDFRELIEVLSEYFADRKGKRTYLFLDEISFVSKWQRAILAIANQGLINSSTLVLTGSNARDLRESSERLPGRRGKGKDLELFPLSIPQLKTLPCFQECSFKRLLEIYMLVGGFPRAIADFVTLGAVTDNTYDIYRNWIVGDASRYDLRQETLKQILFRIAQTMGSRITWPKLIENSPVKSHETALEYVEHLKDAFLCHVHYCYDPDLNGPSFHKARKIYFMDPLLYGVAVCWREGRVNIAQWMKETLQDDSEYGHMFESTVINHAARIYPEIFFWYSAKEQKEIDLVLKYSGETSLYEVKRSEDSTVLRALGRNVSILHPQSFEKFLTNCSVPRS